MPTPVAPTSAWRFLVAAGFVIILALSFSAVADAQTTNSGLDQPVPAGLDIPKSNLHFDVSHSSVTDSQYAAMQARARQVMAEKNHAGRIEAARNGTAGQWVAIKTAWVERDPSIVSHYAGRWLFFLSLAVVALRVLFR